MKISLVGSYHLEDGYLGGAKALEKLGHQVSFIPAQRYKTDFRLEHFNLVLNDLRQQNPDIVLWWRGETFDALQIRQIKQIINKKFILYSFDDPFQWFIYPEIRKKCKYFDFVFTCCQDSIPDYKAHGCKNVFYSPPGFDPEVHYPEEDPEYACDISLVCTYLYNEPLFNNFPHIDRKKLMETLIAAFPERNIKIYGPKEFKDLFPRNYVRFVKYNESRKVFYNSKINICTHLQRYKSLYLNERVPTVAGSKGLLYIDHVKDLEKIFLDKKECVIINDVSKDSIIRQVDEILNNYEKYESIKEAGYKKALESLTWDCWAKKVMESIF